MRGQGAQRMKRLAPQSRVPAPLSLLPPPPPPTLLPVPPLQAVWATAILPLWSTMPIQRTSPGCSSSTATRWAWEWDVVARNGSREQGTLPVCSSAPAAICLSPFPCCLAPAAGASGVGAAELISS